MSKSPQPYTLVKDIAAVGMTAVIGSLFVPIDAVIAGVVVGILISVCRQRARRKAEERQPPDGRMIVVPLDPEPYRPGVESVVPRLSMAMKMRSRTAASGCCVGLLRRAAVSGVCREIIQGDRSLVARSAIGVRIGLRQTLSSTISVNNRPVPSSLSIP